MADFSVSLGGTFSRDLNRLVDVLRRWPKETTRKLELAHRRIGLRWQAEAVKRVPVDKNRLKPSIVTNTYREPGQFITECGSNVKYAPYTEFGTRHIAGGRVLALGTDPHVTDSQAIKDWPAKEAGGVSGGRSGNSAVDAALSRRAARGAASEQMPWLRPAFHSIRDWAIAELDKATEPPA